MLRKRSTGPLTGLPTLIGWTMSKLHADTVDSERPHGLHDSMSHDTRQARPPVAVLRLSVSARTAHVSGNDAMLVDAAASFGPVAGNGSQRRPKRCEQLRVLVGANQGLAGQSGHAQVTKVVPTTDWCGLAH